VRRKTTLEDILENFNGEAYRAVKEIIIIENPVVCGLNGHRSMSVPNKFRDDFIETATPSSFQIREGKGNCW